MKLELTKEDKNKLKELIEIKDNNIAIANMLNYFFDEIGYFYFNDLISIKNELALKTINDAIFTLMMEALEIDLDEKETKKVVDDYIHKELKEDNLNFYLNNEYYKEVKPNPIKKSNYELTYLKFEPFQLFPKDEINLETNFKEITPLGYFTSQFSYLALLQNDVVWMSITPNEINTMKPFIEEMKGVITVFGLGLGYIPFMLSLKSDVKKIIIIENNKDIINIFKDNILKYFSFEQKEKIEIKYIDAFVFLKENTKHFDYMFFDLWHNPNDGISSYIKILKYEEKYKTTTFRYWLEPSLLALARRCLLTLFKENTLDYKIEKYIKAQNITDKIINRMYFLLKDKTFNKIEEIIDILSNENIKSLLKKL